jgi:hypothetical protein
MDNLRDLLGKYTPKEPPEVSAIKEYIQAQFHVSCGVGFQGESIIITVGSGALANTLRFHTARIQTSANTDKRLVIRIG